MAPVDETALEHPVADSLRSAATAQLVLDIATAAAGERELDQILLETLDRLGTVVPLTGGSIALIEDDDLVIRAAIGPFAEEALGQRLPRGRGLSWVVIDTLEPYLTGDIRGSGARMRGAAAHKAIRSWLGVPIVRRGAGIGLLEIDSTHPDAFHATDVELLRTVVQALAGPVELAGRYADERKAMALREAFIGVISHELRTPITTIYGLSKMLRQRAESLAPAVRAQAIEDIEGEADRLYRLVEDLLVLSRAERGKVDIGPEPIVVQHIVRRALEAEASRWPGHRFVLETSPAPPALGETTYIEQVVRNLLTNAAKYSVAGTTITAIVGPAAGEVVVRVIDEGIGFEGDGEALFQLFFRSASAVRQAAGAGIGLFVVRQLVEAMGGRTWAVRRPEGGSEVGFALPIHGEDEAA